MIGELLNNAYSDDKNIIPNQYLGYSTNNVYPSFPPLMSDGRAVIASWQPEATINESLIKANGIKSNWEYRQFLQNNAVSIMKRNYIDSANDIGYYIKR